MLYLLLSSFLFGLSYPLASLLVKDADPLSFAFHFLLTTAIIQIPFVLYKSREVRKFTFTQWRLLAIYGIIGSFLYWVEFSSLKVGLPIAHLTFIFLTVPAWTNLSEYLRGRGQGWNLNKWMLAMVGTAILLYPENRVFSFLHLLPILTAILMALFLTYSKRCQDSGISSLHCSFFNDVFSVIGVLVFIMLQGREVPPPMPDNLMNIGLYAVLIGLLPVLLLLKGLKTTDLRKASTIFMAEPALTGILSILIGNQAISAPFGMGAALILLANLPDETLEYSKRISLPYVTGLFRG